MSGSNINDIWLSMNEDVPKKKVDINHLNHKMKEKTEKKSKKSETQEKKSIPDNFSSQIVTEELRREQVHVPKNSTYDDLKSGISQDLGKIEDANPNTRKTGLKSLYTRLFASKTTSEEVYGSVFSDICKAIFKRFNDPVEKCRELSLQITREFFENACDFVPVLAYFFPALLQRIAQPILYDEEMKVFVNDLDSHEAYKRGKAVDRQDKQGSTDGITHRIVEPSEEIRLLMCGCLSSLVNRVVQLGSTSILHPYFEEIILFAQSQLRDPFPEVKLVICNIFSALAGVNDYEIGMKFYSVAIVRAVLPVLRHKLAKVRFAALCALHKCLIVPDRAKRKASGSDAIQDLVGFREENVLPIAAFYKAEVQVNFLAELVSDPSQAVREQLILFLTTLLTLIEDRYDHQTRLLPYVLDLMTDEDRRVSQLAMNCLQICGKQYETEHNEEILEKLQYGVDGDLRMNTEKPLPHPFVQRPSIGIRLYVRGNTKRFLVALVNELTNWMAPTRMKSASLLKVVVVLCEEHLTMEIHQILPVLVKSIKFARDDRDLELLKILTDVGELLGRYILPEVYIYYLLPRLRGDPDLGASYGSDSDMKGTLLVFLNALLSGSKPSQIVPYFDELANVLIDPFAINSESTVLQSFALDIFVTILEGFRENSTSVLESYYLSTGRLHSMHSCLRNILTYCLHQSIYPENLGKVTKVVQLLSGLDINQAENTQEQVRLLFMKHFPIIFKESMKNYCIDSSWSTHLPEHQILLKVLECPFFICFQSSGGFKNEFVSLFMNFLLDKINELKETQLIVKETQTVIFEGLYDLLLHFLVPLLASEYESFPDNKKFSQLIYGSSHFKGLVNVYPQLQARDYLSETTLKTFLPRFLSDSVVNQSKRLCLTRLCLLCILSGFSFPDAIEETRNNDAWICTTKISAQPPVMSSQLNFEFLELYVQQLLSTGTAPSTPLHLRLATLAVFTQLMRSISEEVLQFTGTPVRRFSYWKTVDHSKSLWFTKFSQLLTLKQRFQSTIKSLVACVDDCDEECLENTFELFAQTSQFILSDEEYQQISTQTEAAKNNYPEVLSYSNLIQKLFATLDGMLKECPASDQETPALNALDQLLRVVCILDPNIFEERLRKEWDIKRSSKPADGIWSKTVNGLFNHVALLTSLQR
jgi:hypothetical protein